MCRTFLWYSCQRLQRLKSQSPWRIFFAKICHEKEIWRLDQSFFLIHESHLWCGPNLSSTFTKHWKTNVKFYAPMWQKISFSKQCMIDLTYTIRMHYLLCILYISIRIFNKSKIYEGLCEQLCIKENFHFTGETYDLNKFGGLGKLK